MRGAVHGDLRPDNVLLQVPPSERIEEPHSWPDAGHAAGFAASALDAEQCTAKISSFALGSLLEIEGATCGGEYCLPLANQCCLWLVCLAQHVMDSFFDSHTQIRCLLQSTCMLYTCACMQVTAQGCRFGDTW